MNQPICLTDNIVAIQGHLSALGWAKMQRQAVQQPDGEAVFNGKCRWLIQEKRAIWRALVDVCGNERAREIGGVMAAAEAGKQLYRMIESLGNREMVRLQSRLFRERVQRQIAWYQENRDRVAQALPIKWLGCTYHRDCLPGLEKYIADFESGALADSLTACYIQRPLNAMASAMEGLAA